MVVREDPGVIGQLIEEFKLVNDISEENSEDFMLEISLLLSPSITMVSSFDNSYLKEVRILLVKG